MSFHLWNLKIFSGLAGRLEKVTKVQVDELSPLCLLVPAEAVVVGVIPDELKAILVLQNQYGNKDLDYATIFDLALKAEFPILEGQLDIGTGPGFEAFYVPYVRDVGLKEGPKTTAANQEWPWFSGLTLLPQPARC
jgi:hypothetical protein